MRFDIVDCFIDMFLIVRPEQAVINVGHAYDSRTDEKTRTKGGLGKPDLQEVCFQSIKEVLGRLLESVHRSFEL